MTKPWRQIVEIVHRLIKWWDWLRNEERQQKEAENKLFGKGLSGDDEAKLHAALERRNRRKQK